MLLFKRPKETMRSMLVKNILKYFSLQFIGRAQMVRPVAKQP